MALSPSPLFSPSIRPTTSIQTRPNRPSSRLSSNLSTDLPASETAPLCFPKASRFKGLPAAPNSFRTRWSSSFPLLRRIAPGSRLFAAIIHQRSGHERIRAGHAFGAALPVFDSRIVTGLRLRVCQRASMHWRRRIGFEIAQDRLKLALQTRDS